MRTLAVMYGEEQYRAWGDLLHSVQTGQPAFEHEFGMDVFEYFRQNKAAGAVFNEAMTNWTTQVSASVAATAGRYIEEQSCRAWNPIRFTSPRCNREREVDARRVESRCDIVGGDFFTSVPPDGDAYLLSYVLHDWDNERCVTILTRCRQGYWRR